jgi:hypothetical protein
MPETEDVKFYNAQDGIRGRSGGPYADQDDARTREIARARAEGREPDLDNPPPFVGNQLVTSAFVTDNLPSNPSMAHAPGPNEALNKVVEDANFLVNPDVLPVDTRTSLPDSERKAQEKDIAKLVTDPANVAATSTVSVSEENPGEANVTRSDSTGANTASAQSGRVVTGSKKATSKKATSKKAASKRTAKKS